MEVREENEKKKEYLKRYGAAVRAAQILEEELAETDFADWEEGLEEIPQGRRNSTMSHCAGKLIKRYGNTDKAYQLFLKQAEKCMPPLEEKEGGGYGYECD